MTGFLYGEPEPTENCPYCGSICYADFVDIGVGLTQCGPYHCDICYASEIGPYDEKRELNQKEKECGWYAPGREPGSSANVIEGEVVTHKEMRSLYKLTFTGNPLHEVPGYVEDWFRRIR